MILEKTDIQEIFRAVKPDFKMKLGKYTHQRVSADWHFHGLAFVKDEMTYVFGMNIGFFEGKSGNFSKTGMNVLVRTNGLNAELRKQFAEFFKKNLKDWYYATDKYKSFRGGEGSEFSRYKMISEFKSKEEIIDFLKNSIECLHKVYPKIIQNKQLFEDVLRASYPWHDSIVDLAEKIISETSSKKIIPN